MEVFGSTIQVLDLDGLERAKTAAGRLKDAVDIAEIRQIRLMRAQTGEAPGGSQ